MLEVGALDIQRIFSPARIALSSRKQGRQQTKSSGMKPKKRECEASRVGLKALGLCRCDVDVFKREAVLIERDAEPAKREAVVPTAMEKANENVSSLGGMPEHLNAVLIALASLLEVTGDHIDARQYCSVRDRGSYGAWSTCCGAR